MNTEIVRVHAPAEGEAFTTAEDAALKRAGEILQKGGLVAFPTETVYGLGGDALNPTSSQKIYAAKNRPSDNPLIIHICSLEDLKEITTDLSPKAKQIAAAFWPGPLTMILNKSDRVPKETTGGLETVAVRFPSDRTAQKLIRYSGGFVAAPSANLSGKPSPTSAKYVAEDMNGRIDMIIDGGDCQIGLESTIVDCTVDPPAILRPGYVTEEMLEKAICGKVDADVTMMTAGTGQAPKAPGMKYRHYAPKGELVIVEGKPEKVLSYINEQTSLQHAAGEITGVIGTKELLSGYSADSVKCIGGRGEEESIARNLYNILREFDDENVTKIYSESFDANGLGQAIMNRLLKAAGHKIITAEERKE